MSIYSEAIIATTSTDKSSLAKLLSGLDAYLDYSGFEHVEYTRRPTIADSIIATTNNQDFFCSSPSGLSQFLTGIVSDGCYEVVLDCSRTGSRIFQSLLGSIDKSIGGNFYPSQPCIRIGPHQVNGMTKVDTLAIYNTLLSVSLIGEGSPANQDLYYRLFENDSEIVRLYKFVHQFTETATLFYYDV